MLGFSPFKKHANKFNYIPRYYDPEKEEREQRRAESRGDRAEGAARGYAPGQAVRTQRAARAARQAGKDDWGRIRVLKLAGAVVLILLFVYLLYPRLAEVFIRATSRPAVQTQVEEDGFNPYAPIRIVPNDYEEGDYEEE